MNKAAATSAATKPLGLFIPICKVDVETRIVHGVATAEAPDRAGEICDYESTKPFFEAWSDGMSKASGGKSLGNVREMHNRSAAGKLTSINFDDGAREIQVAAKIVDEDAWAKVLEGVYTGFSQGGRYVKRWPDADTGLTRYTADPTEISLVDLPCLPGATFDIVKASGVEQHAFKCAAQEPSAQAVLDVAEQLAKASGREAGEPTDAQIDAAKQLLVAAGGDIAKVKIPGEPEAVAEVGEVTEAQIEARAKELADADGVSEVSLEHLSRAKAELTATSQPQPEAGDGKSVTDLKTPKPEANGGGTAIDMASAGGKAAGTEIQQGFLDPLTGKFHKSKRDAERARAAHEASERVKKLTGPVDAALNAIKATLGIEKKDYSTEKRKEMAARGEARPDGSYPIADGEDVANAVDDFNRSSGSDADKAHIKARAKAVGAEDRLPDDWQDSSKAAGAGDGTGKQPQAVDTRRAASNREAVDNREDPTPPTHAERMVQHKTMVAFHAANIGDGHMDAAAKHADAYMAHSATSDSAEAKTKVAFDASRKCMGDACKTASAGDLVKEAATGGGVLVPPAAAPQPATPMDQAAIHSSMAHFHARSAAANGPNADQHKQAAGAHAAAALVAANGDDQADQLSNQAFQATTKCMGAMKGLEALAVFGAPIAEAYAKDAAAAMRAARAVIVGRLGKGLPTVAALATMIEQLKWIGAAVAMESKQEGDDSPVVQQMKDNIAALCATLVAMTDEETRELINGQNVDDLDTAAMVFADRGVPVGWAARSAFSKFLSTDMGMAKAGATFARLPGGSLDTAISALTAAIEEQRDLGKSGSRNSAADQERIQKVHDLAGELGADDDAMSSKAAGAGGALSNDALENVALKSALADLGAQLVVITDRLKKVEDTPLPARAHAFAPPRNGAGGVNGSGAPSAEDVLKGLEALPQEERTMLLIKHSLRNPVEHYPGPGET